MYSHTLPLRSNSSVTHTYTFSHTYHGHLLLESQLRAELVAKRILDALFTFASSFDPDSDRSEYSRAVSLELERIHSTLTRDEMESPEIWRIVEEIQDIARVYGMNSIVERRMSHLGWDPRRFEDGGGFEREWLTDTDEDSDDDDAPQSRYSARGESPTFNSAPTLETIDLDEDDVAFPRSSITVPAPTFGIDEVPQDFNPWFLDQLAHAYRTSTDLQDSVAGYVSDVHTDTEEEQEEESDGGGREAAAHDPSENDQEYANPLRGGLRPRSRRSRQGVSVSNWQLGGAHLAQRVSSFGHLTATSSPYFATRFLPGIYAARSSLGFWSADWRGPLRVPAVTSDMSPGLGNWMLRGIVSDYYPPAHESSQGESIDGFDDEDEDNPSEERCCDDDAEEEEKEQEEEDDATDIWPEVDLDEIRRAQDLKELLKIIIRSHTGQAPPDDMSIEAVLRLAFTCPPLCDVYYAVRHFEFRSLLADVGVDPRILNEAKVLMMRMVDEGGYGSLARDEDEIRQQLSHSNDRYGADVDDDDDNYYNHDEVYF